MAHLSLRFLGAFHGCLGDHLLTGFDTLRTRALLAYLADEPGREHSRLALADLVWPDRPENQAQNNLRNNLFVLRKVLNRGSNPTPFLIIERGTIAFNPRSPCTIDSVEFDSLTQESSPRYSRAGLEQALGIYQGDFLEAFPPLPASGLEEWILSRRAFYQTRMLETLATLAAVNLAEKNFLRAVEFARRQLEIEPWRDEACRQLMTGLALEGRGSAALSAYETFRHNLEHDMGIRPDAETQLLFESIREGKLHLHPEPPVLQISLSSKPDLPRHLTSFVGREEEIRHVKRCLRQNRMLTLSGAGGVGKSRLAEVVAAGLETEFQEGVWIVELAAVVQPSQVPVSVSLALGIGSGPIQLNFSGLCSYLGSRYALLVLDNCEHLIGACVELVETLLRNCPRLHILVTSRVKLGLEYETVYRVPSLDFPSTEHLPMIEAGLKYPAVRLFVDRSKTLLPDFKVTDNNWAAVASICQRLDGIPLALELAATHMDALSPDQLAARLDGSFHLLTGGPRTALPRHQTLRATIEWSYSMLSEPERILLHRLTVFRGGWTLEATEHVCSGETIQILEVMELLTGLVNKSMVTVRNQEDGENRFHLLETVRQFAQEKLNASGEDTEILSARHCRYYRQLSHKAHPGLRNHEHLAWMIKLDHERANIFHALRWAIDEHRDVPSGIDILVSLGRWWTLRCFLEQGISWLRKALSPDIDPPAEFRSQYAIAFSALAQAETRGDAALSLADKAFRLANEVPEEENREALIMAIATVGQEHRFWLNDPEMNDRCLDQCLHILEALGPEKPEWRWLYAFTLDDKSIVNLALNKDEEVERYARRSWEIYLQAGDHWCANPLRMLGIVARRKGDYAAARDYFKDALAHRTGVEDAWGIGDLVQLAYLECELGHYCEAVGFLREAIWRSRERFFYYDAIKLLEDLASIEIKISRGETNRIEEKHLCIAARLLGAAKANRDVDWLRILLFPSPNPDAYLAELRERLDPLLLTQTWEQGLPMNIEQATRYALEYPLE